MNFVIYAMIFLGAGLMVFNIYGFIRYTLSMKKMETWKSNYGILYVPVVLLTFFLFGYIGVALFGEPTLLIAGILFGGSIFVFIVYKLITIITKRLLASEETEAELMASKASSAAKSDFLASVSHEMRTPLNVINGQVALALKDHSITYTTRDHLEKIDLSARHLTELINNILEMNEIENGHLEVKNEEFSLDEELDQINAIAGALCFEKGLRFLHSVTEDSRKRYFGDKTQLRRVLISILNNAAKYTDEGSVDFSVESEASGNDSRTLRFIISDTGIGMDEDFIPKLFEAFSQEDSSATNRFGGGGLSLAIAWSIIRKMGGTIEASSKKGEGSVFTVTVTLKVAGEEANREMRTFMEGEEVLAGRKILIVEDIPANAEIVADLLELAGAESEHAENGQIAVDMFSASRPGYYDAILMDLRMPVMNGYDSARAIRALERADAGTVPIIALTANTFDTDIKQSLDAGMNAHLAKPADTDILYGTLVHFIEERNVC